GDPPGVFATSAIIVVAAAHPVQSRSVQDVAPLVEQSSVVTAVAGGFAVTMEFATDYSQIPLRPAAMLMDGLYSRSAGAVNCRRGRCAGARCDHRDGLRARAQIHFAAPKVVVVRIRRSSCGRARRVRRLGRTGVTAAVR